ncbi:MAG: DUF3006 domain-containing protein [Limnochordia bacterium]
MKRLIFKMLLFIVPMHIAVSTETRADFSVIGYEYVLLSHGDDRKGDRTMIHHRLIIDRFEGSWAVVEYNGETFDIPRSLLPPEAKEGGTLTVTFRVDHSETAERKKRVEKLMDDLFL